MNHRARKIATLHSHTATFDYVPTNPYPLPAINKDKTPKPPALLPRPTIKTCAVRDSFIHPHPLSLTGSDNQIISYYLLPGAIHAMNSEGSYYRRIVQFLFNTSYRQAFPPPGIISPRFCRKDNARLADRSAI
ncbi:hypothetical protein OCU04_012884 [Sclerotinia nivalis]|uniref:Uncharacterized protein n=1 Tax=Sclerotinia nivalis TaxID=352851 RepID=A0A9X0DFC0_9HELO|nr:hypothetical protein OCU04_012884 [Sclerotinia nivalis]